jgi:hypothetical protein
MHIISAKHKGGVISAPPIIIVLLGV